MTETLYYYYNVNTNVARGQGWSSGKLTTPTIRTNHNYRYIFIQVVGNGRQTPLALSTMWYNSAGSGVSSAQSWTCPADTAGHNIILSQPTNYISGKPAQIQVQLTNNGTSSIKLNGIFMETYSNNGQVTAGNKITTTDYYNVFGLTKNSGDILYGSHVGLSGTITASAWNNGSKGTQISW